jgi:hypothetical protein
MITRSVGFAIGFAAFIILAALAATGANAMGWVPTGFPDRIVGIIMGVTVAVFSNPVAKRLPGERTDAASAAFRRFFAAVMVVAGLVHSVFWIILPVDLAPWVGIGVMLAGFAIIGLRGLLGRRPA